jgi:hypothetical protein
MASEHAPLYIVEFRGDLHDPPAAYLTLDGALDALHVRFGRSDVDPDDGFVSYPDSPDPEDDRIIVWEATPGQTCRAVWHFSGWHWQTDAADLPGGPLEQGVLPGHDRPLYDLAAQD